MLWIHLDNGVLVTSNDNIREKMKLKLRWDEDINSIVGIKIKQKGNSFYLKQPRLIKKLVEATDSQLTANKPLPDIKLESLPVSQIDCHYLLAGGMMLYLAQATQPNIMYAVNYLARFAMNAQNDH
ncbi:hypothetical protein O181_060645 [Austropuccinia psidii MF-1]|uniref:Reverse transcriptase Ty1/copia-type domain-containing protein n=1 Tax=Austropuccinia psidii MF-1 TaxID=1389203 RepID=A0A9Q3HZS6_9BASI|nr:hypothetical protein [Austropuccinia psidii MF-1]